MSALGRGAVFVLDERLEADSLPVGMRDRCLVRLVRDARHPRLLLIPAMGRFRAWWELTAECWGGGMIGRSV